MGHAEPRAVILRSLFRSLKPGETPPALASASHETWVAPPRYDIEEVAVVKTIDTPDGALRVAELDLDGAMLCYCMSSAASEWRVRTLFTKEPGTIDWIHSFEPGCTLVDVGANVGMYSLYAAAVASARVYSFEPESQNYAELCRSVYLNEGFRDRVLAWCAAIGEDPVEVSRLLVRRLVTGDSFHDFGTPSREYSADSRFAQGSVAFSLDHLVETGAVPVPDHVKIDVDGHEDKVVRGMKGLLKRRAMRTVLFESDPGLPGTLATIDTLLSGGWLVNPDQVRFSRDGVRPAEAVMAEVRGGRFVGNIIFGREARDLAFATRRLEAFSGAQLERMLLPA